MALLKVEQLTHRYGDITALEDVSLEIPEGRVGLVGANGAGKTTLLRILLGMLHPQNGEIEVLESTTGPVDVRYRSNPSQKTSLEARSRYNTLFSNVEKYGAGGKYTRLASRRCGETTEITVAPIAISAVMPAMGSPRPGRRRAAPTASTTMATATGARAATSPRTATTAPKGSRGHASRTDAPRGGS